MYCDTIVYWAPEYHQKKKYRNGLMAISRNVEVKKHGEKYCIELGKSLYCDIAAPIRSMRTFSEVVTDQVGSIGTQSKVDFYGKNKDGKA